MSTPIPFVEMRGIVKRFPGVLANDNIDLDIHGEKFMLCWAKMAQASPLS